MRVRDQRGLAFPSPVVMLSIIAVAMAGIAYVATQGTEPTEREVNTAARPTEPSETPKAEPEPKKRDPKPAVRRGTVSVEVYNNSGITGLADRTATRASEAGWEVVGSDNWYGTIPASTVYYPRRLEAAGKLLALDLGIRRVMPAIDGIMDLDRLTVVLTADAA